MKKELDKLNANMEDKIKTQEEEFLRKVEDLKNPKKK